MAQHICLILLVYDHIPMWIVKVQEWPADFLLSPLNQVARAREPGEMFARSRTMGEEEGKKRGGRSIGYPTVKGRFHFEVFGRRGEHVRRSKREETGMKPVFGLLAFFATVLRERIRPEK
jgi:hypothetical protein